MTNISGILETLSQAKAAMEENPNLHSQISELETKLVSRGHHIQTLELTIHGLREELAELRAKLAGVEAARDEAMFRELEAEDKADKALAVVRKVLGEASDYIAAVTPAPEPVKEPPVSEPVQNKPDDETPPENQAPTKAEPDESGPFVESTEPRSETAESSPLSLVPTSESASASEPTQTRGKYHDEPYWTKPTDVSWVNWVAEGGENAPWNH